MRTSKKPIYESAQDKPLEQQLSLKGLLQPWGTALPVALMGRLQCQLPQGLASVAISSVLCLQEADTKQPQDFSASGQTRACTKNCTRASTDLWGCGRRSYCAGHRMCPAWRSSSATAAGGGLAPTRTESTFVLSSKELCGHPATPGSRAPHTQGCASGTFEVFILT